MKEKRFGRLVSAVAAAALAVTGLAYLPQSAAELRASALSGQSAFNITSQMTVGWNLGNTLDCSGTNLSITSNPEKFATKWGNPAPNADLYKTIRNAGFNTVRIPTTWYEHIEWDADSNMYLVSDSWMDYVKQNVDWAYEQDMFVIINVHHENWVNVSQFTDATYQDAAKKLADIWTQVAETFQDYDQHLIFEGMNEPRQTGLGNDVEWGSGDSNSRAYINNLNKVFVDTIRSQGSAANAERLLMLPGYCASSDSNAVNAIEVPANGGNIALSVHAYAPYFFTMDTSNYASHEFPGRSGYGEDYQGALTNLFNSLKSISDSKGVPIIIGEFGASDFNNTDARVAWATDYLTKAKAAGIPCVLWDNNEIYNGTGEAHGYLYRKTNTWYPNSAPVIQAMMQVYGVPCTLPAYEEYVEPEFDWSLIPVGDDWIELFRPKSPKVYKAWANGLFTNLADYVNENYDIVLIGQSTSDQTLVLQGSAADSWNYIYSSSDTENFMTTFTYEDVLVGLAQNGESIEDMVKFYVSATSDDLTVYGLYAVPKQKEGPVTILGDVDGNGVVSALDAVTLQKFLLNIGSLPNGENADLDGSGTVDVIDLVLLKQLLQNVN